MKSKANWLMMAVLLAASAGPGAGGKPDVIEGAVVSPVQNANVGAEVSGIVESFRFNEGDLVRQGEVVAEVSPRRYEAIAKRAVSAREARKRELAGVRDESSIKGRLYDLHGTTRMALSETKSRQDVAEARVREADADVELAKLNRDDCRVRAPFTGYLAVRYKQPHEPVDRLEKLFALVDTSKVYAVGNVAEDQLARFPIGATVTFTTGGGKKFTGRVDRTSRLIDPASRTKRLHVLIDNARGDLEVGMSGTIGAAER
jgi:RND family efflux transporter MFP subunit